MGGKKETIQHFEDALENCDNIISSYESMEIKQNDITSGKFQMSDGIDCTTNEFIDKYRYKPLI